MHNLHLVLVRAQNVNAAIVQVKSFLENSDLTENNWFNIDCIINKSQNKIEFTEVDGTYIFTKDDIVYDNMEKSLNKFTNKYLSDTKPKFDDIMRDLNIGHDTKDRMIKYNVYSKSSERLRVLAECELLKHSGVIDIFIDEYFPFEFTRFGITHFDSYLDNIDDSDIFVVFINMHS